MKTQRPPIERKRRPRADAPPPAPRAAAPRVAFFSFLHPSVVPGGAQLVAKRMRDAHATLHGEENALFIAADTGAGPRRPAGSALVQVAPSEFVYVSPAFDYLFFTNHDSAGQAELLALLDSFRPDALHFHHFMGFGLDFLQSCLARYRAKSVLTVHEHLLVCHNDGHLLQNGNGHVCTVVDPVRCASCLPHLRYDYFPQRKAHVRRVVEKFDVVTAVSRFTADVVEKGLQLSRPIEVIPNGPVRPPARMERASADPVAVDLRVGFIGQVHRTKGLHLLLGALTDLRREKPELPVSLDVWGNFVGSPAYREDIDRLVAAAGEAGVRVEMHGSYDAQELGSLLHDVDVVVVPSLWPESYCLTADEALQHGKVLVCSDFPAIRERYQASAEVRFFPMGSRGGLLRQLRALRVPSTPALPPVNARVLSPPQIYDSYARHF